MCWGDLASSPGSVLASCEILRRSYAFSRRGSLGTGAAGWEGQGRDCFQEKSGRQAGRLAGADAKVAGLRGA